MAMKASELVAKAIDIAKNYKTLYVMGCYGAPMNATNKTRYITSKAADCYNGRSDRKKMINAATADTFGFDCVCLIKGIAWGWRGDASHKNGGASYPTAAAVQAGAAPDYSADGMIKVCKDVSTNFSNIVPGEAVWLTGHIGIYIGDGLVVESTPAWANKVQITALKNIGTKAGYNARSWTKHGKLPFIDYSGQTAAIPAPAVSTPVATAGATIKVGDIVNFTGTKHYTSSNSTIAKTCKPGKAKVTQTYNGKHPYQLIHVAGGGSTVYGWVDKADISPIAAATSTTYNVKLNPANCKALNIRSVPGYKADGKTPVGNITGCIRDSAAHSIVEEKDGWGRLGDGRGWIALSYTLKI